VGGALEGLLSDARRVRGAASPQALMSALAARCSYALTVPNEYEALHPLTAGMVLLATTIAWMWRNRRRTGSMLRMKDPTPVRLLHELDRAFARLGMPRHRSTTLQEHVTHLRRAGRYSETIGVVQAYLYEVAFCGEPRNAARERKLCSALASMHRVGASE
jgi:hypothetical protein